MDKRKNNEKAFEEACARNGLNFKKHEKETKSEHIKLVDEDGNCFQLNNDLSIKKCCLENEDNDFAAAKDVALERLEMKKMLKKRAASASKKKSYKAQKGLLKA